MNLASFSIGIFEKLLRTLEVTSFLVKVGENVFGLFLSENQSIYFPYPTTWDPSALRKLSEKFWIFDISTTSQAA